MVKKQGFKIPTTVFKLTFEDEQYEGLEIRAKSLPLRDFLGLQVADDDQEQGRRMMVALARSVVSWNLEDDDGDPIPVNEDSLGSLEIGFYRMILDAWMGGIATVPNSSRSALNGGGTSQEVSLPMAAS